jgi:hypothetical protein
VALWIRQTHDEQGAPVDSAWEIDHLECRKPVDVGVVRRQPSWVDVLTAIRRVGVPPGQVQAPHFTLVNLKTTFYTRPQTVDTSLQIIGYTVDVRIHAISYTWHWGDGSTLTTDTPGRPYPAKDVTHTYTHATDPGEPLALRVDVTYQGRYRVDGGAWTDIPQPITVPGPTTRLPVKQASAVLVEN